MIRVEHVVVSPGHNFFGHHGGPPGAHPAVEVDSAECVAGRGICGDRFHGHREDYKGQVTFFSMEVLEALRLELGHGGVQPEATRRNIFTRGVDLNALIGEVFELQGVRFAGIEECRPCEWMDLAIGRGARDWLVGRGGLRARILIGGVLRRDAEFTPGSSRRLEAQPPGRAGACAR